MELSNQHYLGNDGANPFYYIEPNTPLGYVDGEPIYQGDHTYFMCMLEDREFCLEEIPF